MTGKFPASQIYGASGNEQAFGYEESRGLRTIS